jgi:hypothetical protein
MPACGKHQSWDAIQQESAQAIELGVGFLGQGLELADHLVQLFEIVNLDLRVPPTDRHQLPPNQLVVQLSGKPPELLPVDGPAGTHGIPCVKQQAAVSAQALPERSRAGARRPQQRSSNQPGNRFAAREPQVVHCSEDAFCHPAVGTTCFTPEKDALRPRLDPGLTLKDQVAQGGRGTASPLQSPKRADTISGQRIVSNRQQQLVREVGQPVDHRSSRKEQR